MNFSATHFVNFVDANVNNDKLSDADFRQVVRNALKVKEADAQILTKAGALSKCKHCGREITKLNDQWHDWKGGVLRQYCWVDQVEGSQLHEPSTTSKPSIEAHKWHLFRTDFTNGKYKGQRLGQAFYNEFRLFKFVDQAYLRNLYEYDGSAADKLIRELFNFH